ncbi:class C sortase [Chordicoccus furentiruminis]|uniref:class C sortase n=1 Tax=Chordicoccus furentiruminis TaxID=2709410 RepID=UPI002ED5CC29
MSWLKKNGLTLILLLILLIGAGLIAYPSFANWWNSFHQSRAVASYAETAANMNTEEYERIISKAQAYNRKLSRSGIQWTLDEDEEKEYKEQLDIGTSGIMGYIDIPKIDVMLPIYHGIDESILQVAVGHIPGTSLPVGGKGSHCVVSGHRGLPSARLFTDIDKLVEGDTFTITVLNKTLTYEVDQIRTVLPTDLSDLQIEKGKDYVTLVTCTPYGINTHRLLVRGHRIENADGDASVIADALQIEPIYIAPFIAVPILILLIIGMFIMTGMRTRRRREKRQIYSQMRVKDDKTEDR